MSFSFRYPLWILIQESSSVQVKSINSGTKGAFGESEHARMDFDYSHSHTFLDIYPTTVKIHSETVTFQLPLQHQAALLITNPFPKTFRRCLHILTGRVAIFGAEIICISPQTCIPRNWADSWNRLHVGGKNLCSRSIMPFAAPVKLLEWAQQAGKLGQSRQFSKWPHESQRKGKYCILLIRSDVLYTARLRQSWHCSTAFHIFHLHCTF